VAISTAAVPTGRARAGACISVAPLVKAQ
jgi:hypothetical protein